MKLHVICIGNELLLGHTINTNLAFIGDVLQGVGHVVEREVCIPDEAQAIRTALSEALAHADVVVTVGGLGPTIDDITRDTVAEVLNMPLAADAEILAGIEQYLARRSVNVPCAAMQRQAMIPQGAEVIPNRNGTAPGLWCDRGTQTVIMLPGPPSELQPMVRKTVLPRLQERYPAHVSIKTIRTCGVPESALAELVEKLLEAYPQVTPAYCARPYMVDVRLTGNRQNSDVLESAADEIVSALGNAVYSTCGESLPEVVGRLLKEKGLTLATAESCTGGNIAAAITDIAGSSEFFMGSLVTYVNDWKRDLLGVRSETLEKHGAVSEETASEMVDGLLKSYHVDAGIAVTGIAGPSGGTVDKPVGLVYIATGIGDQRQITRVVFPGNRRGVRERTRTLALNQLRLQLITWNKKI